jgi:Concanavalin A-like lectin/glucanases superfamily
VDVALENGMMIGCSPMYWVTRDEGDPYADDVIAHLWFDGDYVDRSQFAATYTLNDGAVIGSGQVKFGTNSFDTRYTGGGGIYSANAAGSGTHLSPGNDEFTVEFWYYEPAPGSAGNQYHFLFNNLANGHNFRIYAPSFKGDIAFDLQGGGPAGSVAVAQGWHHVALTRIGGTSYKLWLDGIEVQSKTNSVLNTGTHLSTTGNIYIGSGSTSSGTSFASYYSNFRFTKKCRYTATFSVPTAPFPDPVP